MIASLMVQLATPIARQVMIALGFGLVSYAGVSAFVDQVLLDMAVVWALLQPDVAAYLAVAGVHDALGLVTGSLSGRVALWALKSYELV